ncbi:hypothetical protein K7W42_03970 [Deinococcus sp. HMF7604]|uniref:hypothetical protein n=1 Tax=Deinococcus betulae TaxID=2873312 RepID=UPI001CCFDA90|nr:hypothetical protein [Deinococcus betulae]MBZ9750016.1 hypothetical protein [Deinococcus betulae]
MRSPAQHKAQLLQAKRHATALLAKTPSAQVLHLYEVAAFPQSFQPHWQAFMRIDHSTGKVWRPHHDGTDRATWITAVLTHRTFPLRATLFLLPVAVDLEIMHPNWLLELDEQCRWFDVVLHLEGGDVVAFSDGEDGLRRLTVNQGD